MKKFLDPHTPNIAGFTLNFTLIVSLVGSQLGDVGFTEINEPHMIYNYNRLDEVKKACSSILSAASDLNPDDDSIYTIKRGLSFRNGDWVQESHNNPLIPFNDKGIMTNSSGLHLASFSVKDIDRSRQTKKSFRISAILKLGITSKKSYENIHYVSIPRFNSSPNHSLLSISFQGIYMEFEENGGERVICLLGDTILPSRSPFSNSPREWLKDDQILLVLRYPKTFSLTRRSIGGELKSLNPKSNPKYFDMIIISSQLSVSANYKFVSEEIVEKACNPYPYDDPYQYGSISGINPYNGSDFCVILTRLTGNFKALTFAPNWKCNGTDDFCDRLGPFVSNDEIKATNGSFKDVKLLIQNIKCEYSDELTKVSAVFRVIPPRDQLYYSSRMSGLLNLTVSAEGIWKPSSGQLCMIGCPGIVDFKGNGCDSRICLYIPLAFSIKQRSAIVGRFSSLKNGTDSYYFPVSFEKLVQPSDLLNQLDGTFRPHYEYSKIDRAAAVLERNEPFSFGTIIKKSLLKFPKLKSAETLMVSYSYLSEDLTLHVTGFSDRYIFSQPSNANVELAILSLGPLFGRSWSSTNFSITNAADFSRTPYRDSNEYSEKQLLMNISAQLTLTGKDYGNFSAVFLEGIYDPHVGKMYLIGCRNIRASWNILYESMDLEAGLDCLIEAIVSYPPSTSRWLANPSATIALSTQRTEDDPLYFAPINLRTFPILYRNQREDILSRIRVEGILRIVTLSISIVCISSQLFYVRGNVETAPYISVVMLIVQVLGYSFPLITGAEAIFKTVASDSYAFERSELFHVIDYTVKILVLACFLLTLRLCQKVWKSRVRLLMRAPLEPRRVPSEKKVFYAILAMHVFGYVTLLIIHYVKASPYLADSTENSRAPHEWVTVLDEYVGLVQDFFLLPQIVGNLIWQIDCKPLKNLYFIGISTVRLLPHVYDCLRSPISNLYFSEDYEFVNPRFDFYTKFGDVAIPLGVILLAVIVYVQQKWNYDELRRLLSVRRCRLLPLGSKAYEMLPLKPFEAELVSGFDSTGER